MGTGTSTAPAPAACSGLVIVNSEDGPELAACADPCCTGVVTFTDGRTSTPESRAKSWSRLPVAEDEEW